LLEPDLRDWVGHFSRYAAALASACRANGIELVAVSNRALIDTVRDHLEDLGVHVEPGFWDGSGPWHGEPRLYDMFRHGIFFAKAAIAACRRHPDALIVSLSGHLPIFPGAVLAAALTRHRWVFQVLIWEGGGGLVREETARVVRAPWLVRALARLARKSDMTIACQTDELAPALSRYLGVAVQALPMLFDWDGAPSRLPKRGNPATVGMLNCSHPRKNLEQFVEAVAKVPSGAQIVIQHDGRSERCARLLAPLVGRDAVRIIDRPLSQAAYLELIGSLDVLALPYQPASHETLASGMFFEAAGHAVVPVVPAGTIMAAHARSTGIGIVYHDYSAKGLRDAIAAAIRARARGADDLLQKVARLRRENSGKAMLARLLAITGSRAGRTLITGGETARPAVDPVGAPILEPAEQRFPRRRSTGETDAPPRPHRAGLGPGSTAASRSALAGASTISSNAAWPRPPATSIRALRSSKSSAMPARTSSRLSPSGMASSSGGTAPRVSLSIP